MKIQLRGQPGQARVPVPVRRERARPGDFAPLLFPVPVAELATEAVWGAAGAGHISLRSLEGGQERLTTRLVRLAVGRHQDGARGPVVVRFQEGWLRGVVCRIDVAGGEVRCRLRCDGAPSRRRLRSCRASIAGRLRARGLSLRLFEVSS
jgi:hypothetical protein